MGPAAYHSGVPVNKGGVPAMFAVAQGIHTGDVKRFTGELT